MYSYQTVMPQLQQHFADNHASGYSVLTHLFIRIPYGHCCLFFFLIMDIFISISTWYSHTNIRPLHNTMHTWLSCQSTNTRAILVHGFWKKSISHAHVILYFFLNILKTCLPLNFCLFAAARRIKDGRNGDIADDHYHRYMVNQMIPNVLLWELVDEILGW